MENYPKISVQILGFNEKHHLKAAFERIREQDYPNFDVTYIDNASTDGSEHFVRQNFPEVRVIQTGVNNHYGPAHNKGIASTDGEFVCILNADLELAPNYLSLAIKPLLADPQVAGVQGKLLRPEPVNGKYVLDGTGLTITRSRKIRDRGQLELDNGQYDSAGEVFALNGSSPVYRRSALQDAAFEGEIIDEDMTAFYDDSDLGWRLRHRGWKLWYEPQALVYHERGFGQSPSGYKNIFALVKFRSKFSLRSRRLAWRNRIFLILKNDYGAPFWKSLPFILAQQITELGFIVLFETKTLGIVPKMLSQLPRIFKKRKFIKDTAKVKPEFVNTWISQ